MCRPKFSLYASRASFTAAGAPLGLMQEGSGSYAGATGPFSRKQAWEGRDLPMASYTNPTGFNFLPVRDTGHNWLSLGIFTHLNTTLGLEVYSPVVKSLPGMQKASLPLPFSCLSLSLWGVKWEAGHDGAHCNVSPGLGKWRPSS